MQEGKSGELVLKLLKCSHWFSSKMQGLANKNQGGNGGSFTT